MSQKDYVDDSIDLLSMLVSNELFKDDDKKILDECLTMFFAGTQTVSMTTGNLMQYLTQKPEYLAKIRAEF